jgi:hypothetical protein
MNTKSVKNYCGETKNHLAGKTGSLRIDCPIWLKCNGQTFELNGIEHL